MFWPFSLQIPIPPFEFMNEFWFDFMKNLTATIYNRTVLILIMP